MLVSPLRIHTILYDLLETENEAGPHTALLITPQGELLCHATLDFGDEDGPDADGPPHDPATDANGAGALEDNDEGYDDDDNDDDDEPWLDGPERLRLLLGLASQWEDDESPRVECEPDRQLGRLFLRPIALPEPDKNPEAQHGMPVSSTITVSQFVLVLNGTSKTPWTALSAKADVFHSKW